MTFFDKISGNYFSGELIFPLFFGKYFDKIFNVIKFKTKRNPAEYSGATICSGNYINFLIAPKGFCMHHIFVNININTRIFFSILRY